MTGITITQTGRYRPGVKKARKQNPKTDMTPMVDLGFILITFFVMTARLSEPSVVKLNMPKDGPAMPLGESSALTVLLDGDDRAYYYHGDWKKAFDRNEIYKTNFSMKDGIGKLIREKQQWLDANDHKEGRKGLMLLVKAGKGSSYKNVIDALDEVMINTIKKYVLLSATTEESEWMNKQP